MERRSSTLAQMAGAPRQSTLTSYMPTLRNRLAAAIMGDRPSGSFLGDLVEKTIGPTVGSPSGPTAIDFTPFGLPFMADEAGRKMARPGVKGKASGLFDMGLAMIPVPAARGLNGGAKNLLADAVESAARPASKSAAELMQNAEKLGVDLWVSEGPYGVRVSKIVVPKEMRNQGLGKAVMNDVMQYADQKGVKVVLTPDGTYGGSVPKLKKFYGDLGFVPNAGRNKDYSISDLMYRDPVQRMSNY